MAILNTHAEAADKVYPGLKTCRGRFFKWRIFVIAYISYACICGLRSSWGAIKPHVSESLNWNSSFLGTLDLLYLILYGIGVMGFWGTLGDFFNRKNLICIGLSIEACGYLTIAITGWTQVINPVIAAVAFSINGFGESSFIANQLPIAGSWFAGPYLKTVMGFWSTCHVVGDIMGQQVSGKLFDPNNNTSWTRAILVFGVFLIVCIVLIFCFEYPSPKEANFRKCAEDKETTPHPVVEVHLQNSNNKIEAKKSLCQGFKAFGKHFVEVWKIPSLAIYTICFGLMKAAVFGITLWLPTYLENNIGFDAKQVPWLQPCFTIGQVIGACTIGFISDKLRIRALLVPFIMIFGITSFVVLGILTNSQFALFAVLLFFAGLCIGGPYVYIIVCVTSELGTCNKTSAAAIPGMIDGFGTILSALVSRLIPYFQNELFWVFAVFCLIAALLVLPLALRELKSLLQRKKNQTLKPAVKNIAAPEEGTKESNVEGPQDPNIESKVSDNGDKDAAIIVTLPNETINTKVTGHASVNLDPANIISTNFC